MGNSPQQIQLDPSSFMPLDTAAQPRERSAAPATGLPASTPNPDYSHVQLEPSTFSPIAGTNSHIQEEPDKPYNPAEHDALSRFGHAFAEPFVSAFHGAVDKPQDVNEIAAHAGGGQGGLVAYRAAKKLIEAHDAMVKAKPGDAFWQAAGDFQNAAIDLMLGHKRDAMMHGLSGGVSTVEGIDPKTNIALNRGRELTEGAASGGDLATPLGSTAADVAITAATAGAGRGFSAVRGMAKAGEAAEELGATERAFTQGAPKQPGFVKQVLKGEKVAQAPAENALRAGAKAAGGEATNASLRTALEEPIETIEKAAKANYRLVDEVTGGKFQANANKLLNVNKQLQTIAGTDDAKEATLSASKTRLEWQQEELFNHAEKNGVPKETVDLARSQFRQAQALKDLESKVFKNPSIVSGNAAYETEETIDVDKAVRALQKLQDDTEFGAPRLEQAVGKEGANALLRDMYAAQKAGVKAMTKQQWTARALKAVGYSGAGYGILRGLFGGRG